MSENLQQRLKQLIVETLNLEDITPSDIGDDQALFDTGLGLDSIDVLELVVRIEKEFGIKIESSESAKQALSSVNALAAFIEKAKA
ncbi:MAG: acyl carrier protein [Opitutales bacterium]|nr:acyl carrier protein [Opitutales bacterium]